MNCEHAQCPGHLGKFQSCRDEAIWEDTLDGFYPETGDVEWDAQYTLVPFPVAAPCLLNDGVGPTVMVPAGYYIVETAGGGAVYVTRYETEAEAKAKFDTYQEAYETYLDADED